MEKRNWRLRLMPKWILSYLIVFLIPVIAGLLVYTSAERIIREDIKSAGDYVSAQIRLSFDNITNEVYALTRQIAMDTEINALIEKTSFDSQDRLSVMEAVEKCAVYKANATQVDDYYIYLKNSGCMLTYSGFVEKNDVAARIPHTEKFGEEQWAAIESGEKYNRIIPYAYINADMQTVETVSYVIPIPLYAAEPQGFVVAGIHKSRYQDIAKGIYQHSDFAVLDRDNTLIFSTLDDDVADGWMRNFLPDEEERVVYQGEKYYVQEIYSGVNNLRYISITAENTANQKLSHIRYLMLILFGVCILAGVLFAMYFSLKNYRPMKNILNLLIKQKLLKIGGDAEEGQLLLEAINRLVVNKNKVDQKLHMQRDYVRSSVLSRLMNNGLSETWSAQQMESMCDLELGDPCFTILAFHIYEIEGKSADIREYELRFLIVKNIFEELLGKEYTAYVAEINGVICGIVNFAWDKADGFREELRKIVEDGRLAIRNHFDLELAIAAGNIRSGIENVPQCYSEAIAGIQNMVFRQSKDLLFYDDMIAESWGCYEYYFSFQEEQKLMNHIKNGDQEAAKALIETLWMKWSRHHHLTVSEMQCVVSDIIAAIFKAACQTLQNGNGIRAKILQPKTTDAERLKSELFDYVDAICADVLSFADEKENRIVAEIKRFIEVQYQSMDLNISHIADNLDFNATYLSRVFLANTGESLLSYMNRYRIEKAKELFESDPKLTVENVASAVGFGSSNSFIRVFRKYEYMTPGQWQKMKAEEKD